MATGLVSAVLWIIRGRKQGFRRLICIRVQRRQCFEGAFGIFSALIDFGGIHPSLHSPSLWGSHLPLCGGRQIHFCGVHLCVSLMRVRCSSSAGCTKHAKWLLLWWRHHCLSLSLSLFSTTPLLPLLLTLFFLFVAHMHVQQTPSPLPPAPWHTEMVQYLASQRNFWMLLPLCLHFLAVTAAFGTLYKLCMY